MFALGLWGLDRGGMWRDEAVTYQVARRSVPQIWRLLHGIDAVHGLYYLAMHAVLDLRPGEVLLRLPSVCAAAATAALVAALGARLVRPRVGLWAGLLYAVTPMTGHYAQEGRSYAMVAAGAASATLLLVRAAGPAPGQAPGQAPGSGRRAPGGRIWWAYGAVLGVTCLLHELAVLLLLAHAVTLALARVAGPVWRRWACAAGTVALAVLPMVYVSHAQSAQVAWLRAPGLHSADSLLHEFAGPAPAVFWTCLALAALGLTRLAGRPGEVTCAAVALPLAVVPPATLMLVSRLSPLYVDRYVLYALAGVPLLAATGADRVAGLVGDRVTGWRRNRVPGLPWGRAAVLLRDRVFGPLRNRLPEPLRNRLPGPRRNRTPRLPGRVRSGSPLVAVTGVLAIAVALVHQLPLLRADRSPDHRPDNLAAISRLAARELRPGDAVLYLPGHARATALAYPAGFSGTRDVALAAGAPASGTLYGTEVDPKVLRRRLAALDRVWVVADRRVLETPGRPRNAVDRLKLAVVSEQFRLCEESVRNRVLLRLYIRGTPVTGPAVAPAAVSPSRRPARW
jgi:mannosyltransferase